MFVKINKNYLLVIFFLTLYLSNHRLSSVDSFHQFVWCKYLHLEETKPLLAQVLYGCSYMIHIIVYTKEAVISHEHVTNDLIMSLPSYFKIALSLF